MNVINSAAVRDVLVLVSFLLALWSPTTVRARSQLLEDLAEVLLDEVSSREAAELSEAHESDCCTREKNVKTIGVSDTTGENVLVDIGQCRRRCPSKGKLKKNDFERLMKENPDIEPMKLYNLHNVKRHGGPSCTEDGESCRPSSSRIEQVMTTAGLVSVTVTEECRCQRHPRNCRRQPRSVTLHKDTPLQTTIDVGDCQGRCSHDLGCKATKTRSVSIEGPNGAECLTVVEECGCEPSCYRASLFEHVYNYTDFGDPHIEVIDVGTCIGECDGMSSHHCVHREPSGTCMMSLKRSSRCTPLELQELQVIQKDGSFRTVSTVTSCGCE